MNLSLDKNLQIDTSCNSRLCNLFQILLSIVLMWMVCAVLTITNVFPDDPSSLRYMARTDSKSSLLHLTPWFIFPYPGMQSHSCHESPYYQDDAWPTEGSLTLPKVKSHNCTQEQARRHVRLQGSGQPTVSASLFQVILRHFVSRVCSTYFAMCVWHLSIDLRIWDRMTCTKRAWPLYDVSCLIRKA